MLVLSCGTCATNAPEGSECVPCASCGDVVNVTYERELTLPRDARAVFRSRLTSHALHERSGVWRFRELLPPVSDSQIVALQEGNTPELPAERSAAWSGLKGLVVKNLGCNPTGSYKDAGMTVAVTRARAVGANVLACASTGNTSASLAVYAARAGLPAVVLLPAGHVPTSKLAQALDAGAIAFAVDGDFDVAMQAARELALRGAVYLVNSLNPFRREGQKTVAFELLEARGWHAPDWVIVPGGNLGHCVALAQGFAQAQALGLAERVPRIAVVQAAGAAPFVRAWQQNEPLVPVHATTFATAIKIGNPVSWRPALRALHATGGTAIAIEDDQIAEARAVLARDGLACEPASAATLAGASALRERGTIDEAADVVALLTGSSLKDVASIERYHGDPSKALANPLRRVAGDTASLERAIAKALR